jgi:hypothetical protein
MRRRHVPRGSPRPGRLRRAPRASPSNRVKPPQGTLGVVVAGELGLELGIPAAAGGPCDPASAILYVRAAGVSARLARSAGSSAVEVHGARSVGRSPCGPARYGQCDPRCWPRSVDGELAMMLRSSGVGLVSGRGRPAFSGRLRTFPLPSGSVALRASRTSRRSGSTVPTLDLRVVRLQRYDTLLRRRSDPGARAVPKPDPELAQVQAAGLAQQRGRRSPAYTCQHLPRRPAATAIRPPSGAACDQREGRRVCRSGWQWKPFAPASSARSSAGQAPVHRGPAWVLGAGPRRVFPVIRRQVFL